MKFNTIFRTVASLVMMFLTFCAASPFAPSDAVITLDPGTTYQTITGWEATAYAADMPGHSSSYPLYMNELLNLAVNDLGINRIRLEIYNGAENPTDYGDQWLKGIISEYEYVHDPGYGNIVVNDNDDPSVINPSGFHYTILDHKIDDIVQPMRQMMQANGESLYVNLTYVGDGNKSGIDIHRNPAEYAEFILATFKHIQAKYGWVPDAVEISLEPDSFGTFSGIQMGNNLVATGNLLAANGFHPDFVVPSNVNTGNAINWFDDLITVAGASDYISELSNHRYGFSVNDLQGIVDRAVSHRIDTAMLEWWSPGNTYQTLHQDLELGQNSSWERGALAKVGSPDSSTSLYVIDESDPSKSTVTINNGTKFIRQYFKFIRAGALRIDAKSTDNNFDPLAFINTDGKYVVVVKSSQGGAFSIQGLPVGKYGIKYTTSSQYDVDEPDVNLNSGASLNATIPDAGVITIYAKSDSVPNPTTTPNPTPNPTTTPVPMNQKLYLPLLIDAKSESVTTFSGYGIVQALNLGNAVK